MLNSEMGRGVWGFPRLAVDEPKRLGRPPGAGDVLRKSSCTTAASSTEELKSTQLANCCELIAMDVVSAEFCASLGNRRVRGEEGWG